MTERKPQTPNLPRRFYKEAAVSREGDTFAILLDGKPVRTPQKNHLATTHETLANLIAAEWDAQGELIDPTTMPLTRRARRDGGRGGEIHRDRSCLPPCRGAE